MLVTKNKIVFERVFESNQTAGAHEIQLTLATMNATRDLVQTWLREQPNERNKNADALQYGEVSTFMNTRMEEMSSIMNSGLHAMGVGTTTSAMRLRRVLFKCERVISRHKECAHLAKSDHKKLLDAAQSALSTAYAALRRLDSK